VTFWKLTSTYKAKAEATPLTESEKAAKRRAEKLDELVDGERFLRSRHCDLQYGARLNSKLQAQQAKKEDEEDEVDYKKLDEEVAAELLEAGFGDYEIAKTIVAKSPHDHKSLDSVRLIIAAAIAAAKKLATEQNNKIAAEAAAKQHHQENAKYEMPEPK